jgi:hypothetical protein
LEGIGELQITNWGAEAFYLRFQFICIGDGYFDA